MVETRSQYLKRLKQQKWKAVESSKVVFDDILSRLPVKSICYSKAVSNHWRQSINSTDLVQKHLEKSRKNPLYIASPTLNQTMKLYTMKPGIINFRHLISFKPSGNDNFTMYMICSFNGLICCINYLPRTEIVRYLHDIQIRMCNPSTGESLLLPQGSPSFGNEPSIGVAYELDCTEYKVFRMFCTGLIDLNRQNSERYDDLFIYECEVYSSRTCSWKNIGRVPRFPDQVHLIPRRSSHVFVKGKIYWLVSSDVPGEILSVDMEERFSVIELPVYPPEQGDEDQITPITYLINLQESVAVVVLHEETMDIWVWNEGSWVLKETNDIPFTEIDGILVVSSWEKEIVWGTETHWLIYDVETHVWKRGRKLPTQNVCPAVFPYVESIVPCNGGMEP